MLSAPTAVAEERARIARELHDVVAHGISVIAIQSDAACLALDRDREGARDAILATGISAREALGELRLLLDVLRGDDDAGALRGPLPCLGEMPALVEAARAGGRDVTLTVTGEPRPLPASTGVSAYRIVQEALQNAAGAATEVTVAWSHYELELRVRDEGPAKRDEPVVARERVRVHGGTLKQARRAEGGFELVAVLPLSSSAG